MCLAAVKDNAMFEVDDRELRRTGPSYTVDTVRELHHQGQKDIAWLIGADQLAMLPFWREATALVDECRLIVMARPGYQIDWPKLPREFQKLQHNIVVAPQIDISATQIRARILAGQPIDFLTPPAVAGLIRELNLYRN
jgi:nicotinate-nucleotide adenylyltransferase